MQLEQAVWGEPVDDKQVRDRLRNLDWRRVRQFLHVYEHGTIGQASLELNVTQPALSKSLRSLEADLNVKLFERTPLGVVPTVYGEALALHAKAIQAELRSALAQIDYMRGATRGHVVIGIGPSMAPNIMPLATARLLAVRPGISLSVREGLADELVPLLRRGEIDLAIGTWDHSGEADLVNEVVHRDRLHVIAGRAHPLANGSATLAELQRHPWVLPPQNQAWRKRLDELFIAQGLAPIVAGVESNSSTYIKALLADDHFLSFLPRQSAFEELRTGHLAIVDCVDIDLSSDISLTYRERAVLSPASQLLISELRALGRELSGSASDA